MGQDTTLVVDHVSVAAADAFGLFDDAVEAFAAGVGDLLGGGDLDGWPPGLDGFGQPLGFWNPGVKGSLIELGQPGSDAGGLVFRE